ncbi:MAG: ribonuclease P protein component 1 [Nanoarchaeota archaeon]|nr:ribonuclease P protein component 1 [Nanoarchaeota archaeon]
MHITPHNILRHELIGLECEVLKSRNMKQEGMRGTVADETRNTIAIIKNEKISKVAKAGAEFVFALPDGKRVKIEGSLLVARPENRIKTKLKRW